MPKVEASDLVIIGIILVCDQIPIALFDLSTTSSYVSASFVMVMVMVCELFDFNVHVSTLIGDSMVFL